MITAKAKKLTLKQSIYIIDYNGNSDSNFDNNLEFVDINLFYNKLSIHLLANDLITCIKKRHVLETEDKADEPLKTKVT